MLDSGTQIFVFLLSMLTEVRTFPRGHGKKLSKIGRQNTVIEKVKME